MKDIRRREERIRRKGIGRKGRRTGEERREDQEEERREVTTFQWSGKLWGNSYDVRDASRP